MASARSFKVANWIVEPSLNELYSSTARRKLRPQSMELLVYLADRRGEVVSIDDLQDRLWAGKVVTHSSIYNAVADVRQALADGNDEVFVQTIPKRGYRFVGPVSELAQADNRQLHRHSRKALPGPGWRRVASVALVIILLGAAITLGQRAYFGDNSIDSRAANVPPENSVAILRFDDLSPAGDQRWLSDGIAEEILNSLARIPTLMVSGRTSAFYFHGKDVPFQEIAETLGVRHLVEGSIRRDGNKLRVTYQVIRAKDGFHVYSDTIDRKLVDIFDVQEEIAVQIAAALNVVLDERNRDGMALVGTRDVDAYLHYLQGSSRLRDWYETGDDESIWAASAWFDKAIAEDAGFASAYALRAHNFMRFLEGAVASPRRPGNADVAMTQERALEHMLADYSAVIDASTDPAMRNLFEISRTIFSQDYRNLPRLAIEFDPRVAELVADDLDIASVLGALLIAGRSAQVLDYSERRIRRNPLDGLGYNQAWQAAMVSMNNQAADQYLQRAQREADSIKFTQFNLLMSRVIANDWSAATELAETPGWGVEYLREPILALVYASSGRPADAKEITTQLLGSGHSGPYLALALRELGEVDAARAMIAAIDSSPSGNLIAMYLFTDFGGQMPFDLAWMPNFSARLSEAGLSPKVFRVSRTDEMET